AAHYAVSVDPKKIAIFQLMTTAGGIYGPRAMHAYNKAKNKRGPDRPHAPVVEMPKSSNKTSGPTPVPKPAAATGTGEMSPAQLYNLAGGMFETPIDGDLT